MEERGHNDVGNVECGNKRCIGIALNLTHIDSVNTMTLNFLASYVLSLCAASQKVWEEHRRMSDNGNLTSSEAEVIEMVPKPVPSPDDAVVGQTEG